MKVLALSLALAGLASTAPLNAQIISNGRVTGSPQGATVNGSWAIVGRDGSGNQIYERRIRDSYGNIVVQRARRDRNGNMSIISNTTVNNNTNNGGYNNGSYNNGNNTCSYSRTTNSVGDIIFGHANANTCADVNTRDGMVPGWPGCEQQLGLRASYLRSERQPRDPARASQPQRLVHGHQHPRVQQHQRPAVEAGSEAAAEGLEEGSEREAEAESRQSQVADSTTEESYETHDHWRNARGIRGIHAPKRTKT